MSTRKLVLSLATGIVCLAFAAPVLAVPHAPIVITSDAQFTAANGVINPGAAGTAADPYVLPNWTINGGGNFCVRIVATAKHFEIRNLNCTNAATGVMFSGLENGKLLDSTITQIRGNAGFTGSNDGVGVRLAGTNFVMVSNNTITNVNGQATAAAGGSGGSAFGIQVGGSNYTLDNNRISQLSGAAGVGGNSATPKGGSGGSAIGIDAPGGLIIPDFNVTVTRNHFMQMTAGPGGNGATGTVGAAGGDGGSGGDAAVLRMDGAFDLNASNNDATNLYGGNAGPGGNGGFAGGGRPAGAGGRGGSGGFAIPFWLAGNNMTVRSNTAQNMFAGLGAIGGLGGYGSGGPGGRGGDGGAGGEAAGALIIASNATLSQSNNFSTLLGGIGANGGGGGFGSTGTVNGGNGGRGGNGVGLHYRGPSAFTNIGNVILNQRGGPGGIGGFAGGANGAPGSSLPILID